MNTPPPGGITVSLAHVFCELYKSFHVCLPAFPKQERHTLGQRIEQTILDALELTLSGAYLQRQAKLPTLKHASDKVDLLKYLVRLAHETRSLNTKRYADLEQRVIEIGKMLGGWMRSL